MARSRNAFATGSSPCHRLRPCSPPRKCGIAEVTWKDRSGGDKRFWVKLARTLHKLTSPLLYASGGYFRRWHTRARRQPFTIVLIYHPVVPEGTLASKRFGIERSLPARVFDAQLRFMLRHFVPVRASQAQDPSPAPMRFAVTLDDGYEDNFRVAAPILQRLGVPATFYVVSDFVGTDRLFWWEQLAEMIRSTR